MAESLRIGVVGTSWWADAIYLPTLKSHPQAQVVALCGRNRERAGALAAQYAVPGVFTDYREMIRDSDLDAIVVATPDDLHCPIVLHCAG